MIMTLRLFTVRPEETDKMVKFFVENSLAKNAQGFLRHEVSSNRRDDNQSLVCVLEYWENEESFQSWRKSPEHKKEHSSKPDNEVILDRKQYRFVVES